MGNNESESEAPASGSTSADATASSAGTPAVSAPTGIACTVCYERYNLTDRAPKTLVCGHSFCAACVCKLEKLRVPIGCPNCRRHTCVDHTTLGKNLLLMEMLEKTHNLDTDDGAECGCPQAENVDETGGNVAMRHFVQDVDGELTDIYVALTMPGASNRSRYLSTYYWRRYNELNDEFEARRRGIISAVNQMNQLWQNIRTFKDTIQDGGIDVRRLTHEVRRNHSRSDAPPTLAHDVTALRYDSGSDSDSFGSNVLPPPYDLREFAEGVFVEIRSPVEAHCFLCDERITLLGDPGDIRLVTEHATGARHTQLRRANQEFLERAGVISPQPAARDAAATGAIGRTSGQDPRRQRGFGLGPRWVPSADRGTSFGSSQRRVLFDSHANEEPNRRPVVNQLATSPDHDGQWLPHRGRSTGFRQRGFDDAGPSNASMGPVAGMSDTVLDQLLTLQNLGYGDTTVPPVQPQTAMDVQDTAGTRHLDTDSRQMPENSQGHVQSGVIVDLSEDDSPPGQQEDQSNNENVVDFLSWDEEPQYDGRVFEVFFDREPIDEQEGYHHTGAYPEVVTRGNEFVQMIASADVLDGNEVHTGVSTSESDRIAQDEEQDLWHATAPTPPVRDSLMTLERLGPGPVPITVTETTMTIGAPPAQRDNRPEVASTQGNATAHRERAAPVRDSGSSTILLDESVYERPTRRTPQATSTSRTMRAAPSAFTPLNSHGGAPNNASTTGNGLARRTTFSVAPPSNAAFDDPSSSSSSLRENPHRFRTPLFTGAFTAYNSAGTPSGTTSRGHDLATRAAAGF